MLRHAPDALVADFQRVYGLELQSITPRRAMPLAVMLPDGSMTWRVLDTQNAWTVQEHLTATLVDQISQWMWGMADKSRRGQRPKPIRRPGDNRPQQSDKQVHAMSIDQLDAFMAQPFTDDE